MLGRRALFSCCDQPRKCGMFALTEQQLIQTDMAVAALLNMFDQR